MNKEPQNFSLALVTGATSGIGEKLCHLLASKGINLLITGRNETQLKQLTETLGRQVKVIPLRADLIIEKDRALIVEQIHKHCPDLVINNAGFGLYGNAVNYPVKDQLEILTVDSNVPLELTLEAAKALKGQKKKGTIINIASAAAFYVFPILAVYAASKSCVVQYSRALNLELKQDGIRVLVACPGMIATNFNIRASSGKMKKPHPMAMTSTFAAEEIWRQIQKGKSCHIFDWKTRWGTWLSYLLPQSLVTKILSARILSP